MQLSLSVARCQALSMLTVIKDSPVSDIPRLSSTPLICVREDQTALTGFGILAAEVCSVRSSPHTATARNFCLFVHLQKVQGIGVTDKDGYLIDELSAD